MMNILVLLKMAPDTVEELVIGADGRSLDDTAIRYKAGDSDEHAIEQALLLKERHGGRVDLLALDAPEVDDTLFTGLAKGADQATKLTGELTGLGSHEAAALLANHIRTARGDLSGDSLILVRSQAIDELEGELGAYVAEALGLPYLGVVTAVEQAGAELKVLKEFAGGLRGEFLVRPPAVLGIQSAERAPRYVPIAKVRAVMKSARIEELEAARAAEVSGLSVGRMYAPEAAGRAEMLEGNPESVTERVVELLAGRGLL